jgi:hypothetical protein
MLVSLVVVLVVATLGPHEDSAIAAVAASKMVARFIVHLLFGAHIAASLNGLPHTYVPPGAISLPPR